MGTRWASLYFSLLIGDTFAHVKNHPKISSTFWCFLTFSVCPWKSGSSKEPYDFTVPSSLSTWQIHFSCVLLCADMNCGTLFEKSSTNIIHFFPSSSFLCVFIFWVLAMAFVTLVYNPLEYFGHTFADVLLALPTKARILCLDSL